MTEGFYLAMTMTVGFLLAWDVWRRYISSQVAKVNKLDSATTDEVKALRSDVDDLRGVMADTVEKANNAVTKLNFVTKGRSQR